MLSYAINQGWANLPYGFTYILSNIVRINIVSFTGMLIAGIKSEIKLA